MLYISGIELPIEADEKEALHLAAKKCGLCPEDAVFSIYKRAIDARRKNIRFSYTVAIESRREEKLYQRLSQKGVSLKKEEIYRPDEKFGDPAGKSRPVIVGFGPAGAFAALELAERGFKPIVLERGGRVEERQEAVDAFHREKKLNPENNIQYGEGGAGTFSDGKLFTRIGDPRCEYLLKKIEMLSKIPDLHRLAHPHVGTDKLKTMMVALRERILSLGGEILFHTTLKGVETAGGKLKAILTDKGKIVCDRMILATGHSARDTFKALAPVLEMESKGFAMGVRIEHLRKDIDRAMFGDYAGHPKLGSAEYRLVSREFNAFTFCMCPGGTVVAAAGECGGVVTNGMSEYARTGDNSNAAIVVPVRGGQDPLSGIALQLSLEQAAYRIAGADYCAPAQCLGDFMDRKKTLTFGRVRPSYPVGVRGADLSELLPGNMREAILGAVGEFARKVEGFDAMDAVLTAPETRTSSPVRILRKDTMESSSVEGIYPAGEGAGYAGGILSAAVDGLKAAERCSQ